jgi:hypothetical protein
MNLFHEIDREGTTIIVVTYSRFFPFATQIGWTRVGPMEVELRERGDLVSGLLLFGFMECDHVSFGIEDGRHGTDCWNGHLRTDDLSSELIHLRKD